MAGCLAARLRAPQLLSLPSLDLQSQFEDLTACNAGDDELDSRTLIAKHLWGPPEPVLPTTREEVQKWLFDQPSVRLPVLSKYFQSATAEVASLAPQYLAETAGQAPVAVALTALLDTQPPHSRFSKEDTSHLVTRYIRKVWAQLPRSPKPLKCALSFNKAGSNSTHSSSSTPKRKRRPDTMVIVKKCTCLLGEHKHTDLEAAFKDLSSKRVNLMRLHYQDVQFLVGYAVADTSFQWCFLPGTSKVSAIR